MGKKTIELEPETPYHTFTVDRVAEDLKTSILEGLTSEEAAARLKTYGLNELEGNGGVKWYKVLLRQVLNALVFVLTIAAVSRVEHSPLLFVQSPTGTMATRATNTNKHADRGIGVA